jgi:hypothetical protein
VVHASLELCREVFLADGIREDGVIEDEVIEIEYVNNGFSLREVVFCCRFRVRCFDFFDRMALTMLPVSKVKRCRGTIDER